MKKYLLMSALFLYACGGGDTSSKGESNMISTSNFANPEPNIPLECYTDTGIVRYGKAIANPCYVCHTQANTPYVNEVNDFDLTFNYSFPESILRLGNPWLNAIRPDITLKEVPPPTDQEIQAWIRQDNWTPAYLQRGKGDLKYFPDVPPLYMYSEGSYQINPQVVDQEGFIHDPQTGEHTGWRVFKWKPFPGFFPTNGRIDSTLIRLPEEFRKRKENFDINTYKRNLAIVECAVKGVQVGDICKGTDVGDFTMPAYYEGDAKDVPVVTYQYPPGTEFAHPLYYLDPQNTISFKALRIKEMRYMKKITYADVSKGEDEEEEEKKFYWDKGVVFNLSKNWLMAGFIEDKEGNLRPQSAEEMKFCTSCHGGIAGTVDATFTYWRKVPGSGGWMEQDYNLSVKNIKDWNYASYEGNVGEALKKLIEFVKGEYQLYFSMTNGGDHFRSNQEILLKISKDPSKISFILSPEDNIITNPSLINYLDEQGYIKPELFLPSSERAYGIDKQYFRIVKAQAFRFGRDVFDRPFGVSFGGNSLERLSELKETGIKESSIWAIIKTILFMR
ncbi:hypothetical protein [Hydrogenobacter thermophilus]|uniref:hypothetical protein n=1 Tax=Hydrogenobacter thermophilus TaxID=940 RepID=UPI0030F92B9A